MINFLLGQIQHTGISAKHVILHKWGLKQPVATVRTEHVKGAHEFPVGGRRSTTAAPFADPGWAMHHIVHVKKKQLFSPSAPSLFQMAVINSPKTLIATAY